MESKIIYNSWPNGQVSKNLQRTELDQLKTNGYNFEDAREVIDIFEKKVAEFAGAKYCITTDSCTSAIELSFRYLLAKGEILNNQYINIPNHTYISAALIVKQLGLNISFENRRWEGMYQFGPSRVWDCAVRWKKGMYDKTYHKYDSNNSLLPYLHCVSFQIKKMIPIGKMGAIITDDKDAFEWLKLARYDGRDMSLPYDHIDHIKMEGYHKYATPEDCARGILLMDEIKTEGDTGKSNMYPDVQKMLNEK